LTHKTAIVTGSGRGIGKETAILLSKNGFNVVVCCRTQREIDSTAKEIKEIINTEGAGDGILCIRCDVSISSEVDYLIKSTIEKFKNINVLINNAGIVYIKTLVNTSEEEWDNTINTNLKGAFLCTKAVLPSMIENKSGVIINVSSGAGKTGFPDLAAYCASKFGMIGLTESLAWETGNYNIKVMAICPGEVSTKMQEITDPDYYRKYKDKMLRPEQVAEKIVEMILDDKKYRSGQSIDIG
jgi:3-oxoacyl-[acyl-carrier protein] reductase